MKKSIRSTKTKATKRNKMPAKRRHKIKAGRGDQSFVVEDYTQEDYDALKDNINRAI